MIKFHPTDSKLVDYLEGGLASAESILTSAHCDMCCECREKVSLFTESLASQVFDDDGAHIKSIQRDFISMFEHIINQNHAVIVQHTDTVETDGFIELEGRKFKLPPTLARVAERRGEWSHLVGKLWQAQVDIGEGYLAQFIYMEKGGSVPEHTHKGSEMTLVLDGEFADGIDVYRHGDFITLNDKHIHSPISEVDEGCLVFSIIDQPLYFTSGWAKLINPLSSLYYHVNAHR